MEQKHTYYRRIEIIRDLSCILVLLYHLNILKGSFLAVCTFFALSGYLTCMSALKNNHFSIKSYYIKRLKRLYLPLLIVVFGTVILVNLNTSINWMNLKPETTSVVFGYNNVWQLNANLDYFTRTINSPFTHLWYIAILLQFDLVFPIIFALIRKAENKIRKNISTVIVALLTVATTLLFFFMAKTQDIMTVYYNTFARSFSLFFGILLALLHYKHNINLSKRFSRYNTLIFTIYNILLIGLCIFIPAESSNYAIYMILATIISTRLIEYSTKESKKTSKHDKLIKVLSKISYEVYLVQYPVIFFMKNWITNDVLVVILSILLTFIISFVLHLLIDYPLRNKLFKIMKALALGTIIVCGSFIVITAPDHSEEMKELENLLNENAKKIEEKNKDYINSVNAEIAKYNAEIKDLDNNESSLAETIKNLPVVGIGDSVLLGTIDEFYKVFPNGYFDGKVSRTIPAGKEVLIDLKNQGKVGDIIIICLGINGDYSDKLNKDLMDAAENREVYWVNCVGADDPQFNDRFKEFAKDYPNIHIVDWVTASKNHPEYFYADGIHVKGDGVQAYVNTIYQAIYDSYKEINKTKKTEMIKKQEDELKSKILLDLFKDVINKPMLKY